jgi:hypothetical protein
MAARAQPLEVARVVCAAGLAAWDLVIQLGGQLLAARAPAGAGDRLTQLFPALAVAALRGRGPLIYVRMGSAPIARLCYTATYGAGLKGQLRQLGYAAFRRLRLRSLCSTERTKRSLLACCRALYSSRSILPSASAISAT